MVLENAGDLIMHLQTPKDTRGLLPARRKSDPFWMILEAAWIDIRNKD
jgi:hypothetical protein